MSFTVRRAGSESAGRSAGPSSVVARGSHPWPIRSRYRSPCTARSGRMGTEDRPPHGGAPIRSASPLESPISDPSVAVVIDFSDSRRPRWSFCQVVQAEAGKSPLVVGTTGFDEPEQKARAGGVDRPDRDPDVRGVELRAKAVNLLLKPGRGSGEGDRRRGGYRDRREAPPLQEGRAERDRVDRLAEVGHEGDGLRSPPGPRPIGAGGRASLGGRSACTP